jgi:hypothetical protein
VVRGVVVSVELVELVRGDNVLNVGMVKPRGCCSGCIAAVLLKIMQKQKKER